MKYSVIIPVYNRPQEMVEMLDSLAVQTYNNFEVIIVEDGSDDRSDELLNQYQLDIKYFFKENTGPGDSRNFGMARASGEYFLFFDSDCVLPPEYFEKLEVAVEDIKPDAFGGPDDAHESFSDIQKAINYSMTSFLTTGGIRGGKRQLDKYQPRSFNMGISKKVYQTVGGFSDIHPGEDPDLSFRIMEAGFKIALIRETKVFHKRRIDFSRFAKQVYKFGVVRVILNKWYPKTKKLVYFFPSLFLVGLLILIPMSLWLSAVMALLPALYAIMVFLGAIISGQNLKVSILSVPAAFIQLMGYGYGFITSWWQLVALRREERNSFKTFFFDNKK